jgi:2-polyprenyl-6-methoxyphenol hydroxylase-like FAD-dependent oxidoreductase
MDVLIAGGGIGGLTTALYLHKAGIPVTVYEAVPEIRELGVGINLLPHAVRGLEALGLRDAVVEAGVATQELAYFNKHGQTIWSEPRGLAAGYKWPQVSIHRGRLQAVLLAAARKRLGAARIVVDRRLTDFEQKGDQVVARFSDHGGTDVRAEVTGDILIAVDGIHSRARRLFYPDQGDPQYSGLFMWRAVSMSKPYRTGATMAVIGHTTQRFVCYPITRPDENGRQLINWIAHLTREELMRREDWNQAGNIEDFIGPFEDWAFDWLDVPEMIRAAEAVYEFPMVDRDPLPRWSFDRVTLLGDAAHPMYPIGSNGASQAILDAETLTDALLTNDDPVAALKAYEAVRLPATAQIVRSNRQQGPEIVMQMVEDRAPDGFDNIEDVIPRRELEAIAEKYKVTAGFDKESLNRRAM